MALQKRKVFSPTVGTSPAWKSRSGYERAIAGAAAITVTHWSGHAGTWGTADDAVPQPRRAEPSGFTSELESTLLGPMMDVLPAGKGPGRARVYTASVYACTPPTVGRLGAPPRPAFIVKLVLFLSF